jgi:hypothetical protein
MKEYNETAVIVDKKVWEEMNERLTFLEKQGKTITVNIDYDVYNTRGIWPYYLNVGSFKIENADNISSECIDAFKENIQKIVDSYAKYNNLSIDLTNAKTDQKELSDIKETWIYKLFLKNKKL